MKQSILLYSSMIVPDIGLNSIFCCLKMKSVFNILGYFLEHFQRFSLGLQPLEGWIQGTMQQTTTTIQFVLT